MMNFSIQSFTLMMMMMTFFATPAHNLRNFTQEELLKEIKHEASELMMNKSSELKKTNVMFLRRHSVVCPTEFFCLAEKFLNSMNLVYLVRFTGLLKAYNSCNETVNCTSVKPVHTTRVDLFKLVNRTKTCSEMTMK